MPTNHRWKGGTVTESVMHTATPMPQIRTSRLGPLPQAISRLSAKIGELSDERADEVERALGYAFDIDRLKDP